MASASDPIPLYAARQRSTMFNASAVPLRATLIPMLQDYKTSLEHIARPNLDNPLTISLGPLLQTPPVA
jgi:hypothetical protein